MAPFAFGGNQPSQAASPFGQTIGQTTAPAGNMFGGSTNTAPSGPFGSSLNTSSTATPASHAFGGSSNNAFGNTATATTPAKGFDFTASASGQSNSGFNFGQSRKCLSLIIALIY